MNRKKNADKTLLSSPTDIRVFCKLTIHFHLNHGNLEVGIKKVLKEMSNWMSSAQSRTSVLQSYKEKKHQHSCHGP